jgi:ABC-2 type transport system ATP-binding protein
MRLLTGYLAPSEGTASIAGMDMQKDRTTAASRLGYLPENGPLYLEMTPFDLLRFFGEARGLAEAKLNDRIDFLSNQFSLQDVMEKPIGKLSRGYRQRVGLAQSLIHDPNVLIMDEPTSGLDPNQIREFRREIQELGKTKTILISTHILQEVEAIAARVLFLDEGKLIFDGTPEDLKENDSLEEPFYRMTNYGQPVSRRTREEPVEDHQ